MKKTKSLAIVLAILFLATTFISSNVFAREYSATAMTENPKTLTITRRIENVTNPVTNSFDYKIELLDKPTTATVTGFPNTTGSDNGVVIEDLVTFNEVDPDNNEVATATGTLSLTTLLAANDITFNELGNYRFKITEFASDDATTYPVDGTNSYEICIFVSNKLDSNNAPTGQLEVSLAYVKDLTAENVAVGAEAGKLNLPAQTLEFESESQHTYIELTKNVTGDGARRDEYFQFEIELTHLNVKPGDVISVSNKDGNATDGYHGGNQYATVTVDANNKITVYAKHGETIVIGKTSDGTYQLPLNTVYTIVETDYSNAEAYTTKIDNVDNNDKTIQKTAVKVATAGNTAEKTAFETNNTTEYVNNRNIDPITGIFVNVMPFVLLIAVAFVGIILIKKSSKKED